MGFEPMGAKSSAELAIRFFRPLRHPSKSTSIAPHRSLVGKARLSGTLDTKRETKPLETGSRRE